MKPKLSINKLITEARLFCVAQASLNHNELLGITDGKAVGTYIEHKFKEHIQQGYSVEIGNSASGIDLPSKGINTDIKVTSIKQPQSSCPYKSANQKIFGLGYNLLVFVYEKTDSANTCNLKFLNLTFIDKDKTADYTTTRRLIEMLSDGANKDDIISYLQDRNVPGDEIVFAELADQLLKKKPEQGYLTISNALQWRLQYNRVISMKNQVKGVINFDWE